MDIVFIVIGVVFFGLWVVVIVKGGYWLEKFGKIWVC